MSNFNLVEVINSNPLKVNTGAAASPFYFGAVKNLFPNVPSNSSSNPNFLGAKLRHKQFGGGCVGKNNVGYFVTRVSDGHGKSGGNIYWSKTKDEGNTWSPLTLFDGDTCVDSTAEDLRDCTLYYDELTERYFLIYVHQYGIVNNNYDNVLQDFKVLVYEGEPFESTYYDISPGVIPLDGQTTPVGSYNRMQNFGGFHRVASHLYLPMYFSSNEGMAAGLLDLTFSDVLKLSMAVTYMSWNTVYQGSYDNDNETTFFTSYLSNGTTRLNLMSRGGNDVGYLRYSDDGGSTWTEKQPIGFDIAGGPRVFEVNGGYMLVAREQATTGIRTIFAIFSSDGETWENRTKVDDAGTAYASLLKFESGKTLLLYGLESGHLGIQVSRQVFNLPI